MLIFIVLIPTVMTCGLSVWFWLVLIVFNLPLPIMLHTSAMQNAL